MKLVKPLAVTTPMLTSNVPASGLSTWNNTTTYSKGQQVVNDTTHDIYESVINNNLNNDPNAGDISKWINIGKENRWKMFDSSVGTKTTNPTNIQVTINPGQLVNSVALLNVDAATVRVRVIDPIEGVVFDQTKSLISFDGVNNWAAYFRNPQIYSTSSLFLTMPSYASAAVEITLSKTTGTVTCGVCVLGLSQELGDTEVGTGLSFDDWSVKKRDNFGGWFIQQRDFSSKGRFNIFIEKNQINSVISTLTALRATPTIFIGSEDIDYAPMIIYGYIKNFDLVVAYHTAATYSLDIEGIT